MKTDTLKKSLLDYAIKGKLTAKFRRENSELSAFDELEIYNDKIKQKRKNLEKKLKICEKELKLEKDKDKKAFFKSQIQMLKKELTKCKEITPLFCQESRFFANAQNDKKACHTASTCHTDLERSEREVSKNTESQLVILSECEKSNTESKRDFSFATQTQNAVSLENDNPHTPPFEIPNSWAWVKLGDICEIRLGKTPPRDAKIYWNSNDYQWVSIADMGESKILTQTKEHISQAGREKCFGDFIFKKGTLLLSFKLTIGKVAFLGFDGFHNEGIASVLPLLHAENEQIFKEFLFHFLPPLTQLCESTGAIKGETLNKQKLNNLSIPLPPLCEQQEIVKKLDLLVTLANDFAITKENLKRIEKRIEKSLLKLALEGSLSKLYRRSSPTLSAFDEINTYNEAIKEKRKNLEKELKKCEKELKLEKDKDKKALCKSQIQMLKKELTKCKEIVPLNLSEAPFTIPNSWAWVKLGDICEIISGEIIDLQEENLPLLDVKYLRSKGDKKLANSGNFANANDRLILMDGENSGEIFITKEKGFLGSTLKKLEFSSLSQVEFMDFMLLCYKDFFKGNKKGAAIPHLDRKLFTNLSIPLPPLCEQEHIVQILDTLFTLKKGLD
ncbi:restriction endonuclease subunit S [Campylobacter upsaliensis]|uniref:restriction endonuclease subunit S n=2 Tax=Campylobacter upsaliensis TaxID=28080 RepID=UPI0022EA69EC|nr:restriction endonuclease subunit S [Campylobacter upsaliensis]